MAKKKNTDPVTVILSLAIVLVLCVFIFFGIKYAYEYFILNKHSNNDSNNNDNPVSEVVTNGEISVEIGDYTVYELILMSSVLIFWLQNLSLLQLVHLFM